MKMLDRIKHRKSIRSYNGIPFRQEDKERLLHYAAGLTNPYGIPVEFRILNAKKYGVSSRVITGEDTYIAGKIRRVPHAEEAFGYSFEKLVLYADSLGIGTVWIGGTLDRKAFERAMKLNQGEVLPCVSPLGYPAEKRTLLESLMRKVVKADQRFPFEELFFQGDFSVPLTHENATDLLEPLEMVRWAPSAVNKQPWRVVLDGNRVHFYEKKTKGYENASGWDMQKIDMGIALYHFEAGLEERNEKAAFLLQDPGIPHTDDVEYIVSFERHL